MKIVTAVKYAHEISHRLHEVKGDIITPLGDREGVKVNQVWVFGSTVKGSLSPNDLDLLIDLSGYGKIFRPPERPQAKTPAWAKHYNMCRSSRELALVWLTRGMKNVSRHLVGEEEVEIDVMQMIYPHFEARFPQL